MTSAKLLKQDADEPARRVVGYVRTNVDISPNDDGSSPDALVLDGVTHINLAFALPKYDKDEYRLARH